MEKNTKTLSPSAISTIDQYMNFSIGKAVCSIPYFNNRKIGAHIALRAYAGKGSPKDIREEVTVRLTKDHVSIDVLTGESLKKYLTDKKIGIDCSGLAYYILNAESEGQGKGSLGKHIHFTGAHGLFRKIRSTLRPVENCNVATFADNKNSKVIAVKDVRPGDMITMISKTNDRDHILVIHEVEYGNSAPTNIPTKIIYTHTNAYPEDGVYGTGVRQGTIDISDLKKSILEGVWSEKNLLTKASDYSVEIRRLL